MSNLQLLIETTERLVKTLDQAHQNESGFNYKICQELERMSWEAFRMSNDLKEIKEYCGV